MEQYRGSPTAADMPDLALTDTTATRYAEVWGDTVDLGHLAWSVVLGIGISVEIGRAHV